MMAMTITLPPGDDLEHAIAELDHRLDVEENRRDSLNIIVFVIACIALIAAIVGVGYGVRAVNDARDAKNAAPAGAASSLVTVHLTEFSISPAALTVAEGGTLQVMNIGTLAHTLTSKDADLATADIPPGDTAQLVLSGLKPGTYAVICSVAGHEAAGMKGTLEIVAGTGGAAAPATPSMPGNEAMTPEQMDAGMAASIGAFPQKTEGLGGQDLKPTILADGTKQFELTANVVDWQKSATETVKAWTFNGTVPGPTLRLNTGDKVQIILHNEFPESTAVHFHGLTTPNDQDGVTYITQKPIKSGETYTYKFTAQSTPTVGMYHSHHDAVNQVPNGMAGAIIIGSEPVPAGVTVSQEQVMMLNDSGTIGLTINGKSFPATAPVVAKKGDWIEVHYMNEGGTIHPMHLHGLAQTVIAKDGYPVPQPYDADTILVGPGERYTVLVHATEVGTWAWHCHILTHAERADGMFGMVTALVVQ
jgi:uncharacterized cupredoxin-like copper-binding protein